MSNKNNNTMHRNAKTLSMLVVVVVAAISILNGSSSSNTFTARAFMTPTATTSSASRSASRNASRSRSMSKCNRLLSSMNDDNMNTKNRGNQAGHSQAHSKSQSNANAIPNVEPSIRPFVRPFARHCQSVAAALVTASLFTGIYTNTNTNTNTNTMSNTNIVSNGNAHNYHFILQSQQLQSQLQSQNNQFQFQFQFVPPVNAIEEIDSQPQTDTTINSDILPSSASTSSSNTISTPLVSSPITTPKPQSTRTKLEQSTVIDEVWTLIDKYYLDRTFHNQEWSTIRSQYESKLSIDIAASSNSGTAIYNDDEAMKITNNMVQTLGDKYSRILDKDQYAKIQKFDLIGVGVTLMPNPIDKRIMVGAPPVDGSEAQKGGIQYGDYITAVNGVETKGRTAFQIIDQISEDDDNNDNINGGTTKQITFTVLTQGPDDIAGEGYKRDVTMKRQTMQVKDPITSKITERRPDGTTVGYIRISEFNSLVEPNLKQAILSLKQSGANAFVLDMRSNPGGAFQSAVEVASLFMEDQLATSVVDSNDVEMPFRTARNKVVLGEDVPLVLWIDGGSASATEVLAGALHDQCRASIMGSNSFGKGLIQAVYGLRNGSGLVLTVAKYVTPNGTNIQGSGIVPDVETKLPFLYLPGVSSDTSRVDFKKMAATSSEKGLCPVNKGDASATIGSTMGM